MMDHCPENQAVCFWVYKLAVIDTVTKSGHPAPVAFYDANIKHLMRAFDNGEPIWMAADEMRARLQLQRPAKTKTPRELALRVVKIKAGGE